MYRQLAKRTVTEVSRARCGECGAWRSGSGPCPECGHHPPHEVLDVAPDAPESVVKAAAREKIKRAHPDQGGSAPELRRVKQARDQLLESR